MAYRAMRISFFEASLSSKGQKIRREVALDMETADDVTDCLQLKDIWALQQQRPNSLRW